MTAAPPSGHLPASYISGQSCTARRRLVRSATRVSARFEHSRVTTNQRPLCARLRVRRKRRGTSAPPRGTTLDCPTAAERQFGFIESRNALKANLAYMSAAGIALIKLTRAELAAVRQST